LRATETIKGNKEQPTSVNEGTFIRNAATLSILRIKAQARGSLEMPFFIPKCHYKGYFRIKMYCLMALTSVIFIHDFVFCTSLRIKGPA